VLDDRRVRFRLVQPLATFLTDMEIGIVCSACAERGELVGAGPYRLVSREDDEVVMERNPHYFRGLAPLRRLVFRTMVDANARILVMAGGAADLTQNTVRLDLVPDVERLPRLRVTTAPSALLTYLLLRNDDPILADVRVRRAIAYAIDRERIIRAKLAGRAVLATGLIAPGHWAYSGDVPRYPYDPERARALLDEAGWPDPDGPGPGVRFTLTYKTSSDAFRVAIARAIAQMLGEVGIGVEVRSFEFATFFADVKKGQYQLASLQTSEIAEPDMYITFFHSSRIPTPAEPDLANRWHYRSAEADRLIDAGRRELDRAKRIQIYAELQRLVASDVPIVPLWHENNVAVMNMDVEGYQMVPTARLSSLARTTKTKN
jgi:peptide/nickel transport system substrate-binding protein